MACLLEEETIPHPLSFPAAKVVPSLLFHFGKDGPKLAGSLLLSSFYPYHKFELGASYAGWQSCPAVTKQNSLHHSGKPPWFHHDI